jgi:hypothetical protein
MHIVQEPEPDESFLTEKTGLRLREVWITACSNTLGRNGIQMSNGQERVAEDRAAVLLGLTMTEIRSFSRISGLGHLEYGDRGEQMVFTYDELQRLCLLAAQSSK